MNVNLIFFLRYFKIERRKKLITLVALRSQRHLPIKQKTLLNTMADITNNDGNALQFFASNPGSVQLANIDKYKEEAT
jgi:hypothetical protein